MSEIRHVARLHGSPAPMLAHRRSTSRPIEPPGDARGWQGTGARDWLRLRTMVDALLRRAAAARDAADAVAATSTTSQAQEVTHG